MNASELVEKFVKKYNVRTLREFLETKIKLSDLQWFFIEKINSAVRELTPVSILKRHKESRLVRPCDVSPKDLNEFESIVYEILPDECVPIELSPVMSIGGNSVLANISQGNVLSTVRALEVTADSTMALTIEVSSRIAESVQSQNIQEVFFCSNHRCLRLQGFSDDYGFTPHFKVLAMCSVWRRQKIQDLQIYENLRRQIIFYLDIIELCRSRGFEVGKVVVEVSDITVTENLINFNRLNRSDVCNKINDVDFDLLKSLNVGFMESKISATTEHLHKLEGVMSLDSIGVLKRLEKNMLGAEIKEKYSQTEFVIDIGRIAGLGYYNGPCFKIYAETSGGKLFPLADGGSSDWAAKLLSDNSWGQCTSGFGSELFCRNFMFR